MCAVSFTCSPPHCCERWRAKGGGRDDGEERGITSQHSSIHQQPQKVDHLFLLNLDAVCERHMSAALGGSRSTHTRTHNQGQMPVSCYNSPPLSIHLPPPHLSSMSMLQSLTIKRCLSQTQTSEAQTLISDLFFFTPTCCLC